MLLSGAASRPMADDTVMSENQFSVGGENGEASLTLFQVKPLVHVCQCFALIGSSYLGSQAKVFSRAFHMGMPGSELRTLCMTEKEKEL